MRALVYHGSKKVRVESVSDARIEQPNGVKPTGAIGVVGVFVEEDPKSPDKLMKQGKIAFDVGKFFEKGLRMGSGQCDVKRYNRRLCELIEAGRATPSFIVSHILPLDDAAAGYEHFDAREEGWTKVVLDPWADDAVAGPAAAMV